MALIKCPECGKEVSDKAQSCPNCGFGVVEYYENERIQAKEEILSKQKEEIDKKLMENIPLPQKPKKPLFFANSDMQYLNALQMYEFAMRDPDGYRRRILEAKRTVANAEAQNWLNRPKCPNCKSDSIEKISTTSRAASIAAVGLASAKIGKQYKCKKCNHMW